MQLTPIGTLHTPFAVPADMPIQPAGAAGSDGWIELREDLVVGLKDLEGFSHILVIYIFHRVTRSELIVTPFLDDRPHGIFATRAPTRPNPVGLSLLTLRGIEGNRLEVSDVDMLDGSPLLDIKPFVPAFDGTETVRTGWLEKVEGRVRRQRSDDRFT